MPSDQLSRRRFLSAGALAAASAAAGCLDSLGSDGGLGGDAPEESSLRLTLSDIDGPLRDQFVVDLSETRLEWDEEAFEITLDGETYTTQARKPFFSAPESPKYTERDGTYYRLGSVVVDEVTTTHPVLRLSAVGEASDDSPDSVPAEEFPKVDRNAVQVAYFAARARDNPGGVPWGLVQRGGYVYRGEAVEASRLLAEDGPAHVTFRNRIYAVEIAREQFHEPVYRATVEPVADDPEQMEAILRAQFVEARFSRDDLSDEAKDVVDAARRESYAETHPFSTGYEEVLRALHARAYIDGNVEKDAGVRDEGRRMLRYDGVYYDYRLRFVSRADR